MDLQFLKSKISKVCSLVLAFLMIIGSMQCAFSVSAAKASDSGSSDQSAPIEQSLDAENSYFNIYESMKAAIVEADPISASAVQSVNEKNLPMGKVLEKDAVTIGAESNWCEFSVNVPQTGAYALNITYSPDTSSDMELNLGVMIDGIYQFSEAQNLNLARRWKSKYTDDDHHFEIDAQGNDVRPAQEQLSAWLNSYFIDSQGLYDEPYLFYLTAGTHTVRISSKEVAVAISDITFKNAVYGSYSDYLKLYEGKKIKGDSISTIQAEIAEYTSSKSIYPTYDKTNAGMTPTDPKYIYLNCIGSNCTGEGDEITWKADVKEAGLYRITLRGRQTNSGLVSYRELKINGKIPFKEAADIPFKYSQNWTMSTLGDGKNDYYFYLEPGDLITLSVSAGLTSETLREVQSNITALNALYREVIAITSANPDAYQEYDLEVKIPNLKKRLNSAYKNLEKAYKDLSENSGGSGSVASTLSVTARTIKKFANKPYEIPERLSSFKNVLETLGSMILTLNTFPLEIDYISFMAENAEVPKAGAGFFKGLDFGFKQFIYSFTNDYTTVGGTTSEGDKPVKVWINTGRDQAQIISNLISSEFTEKTGINVNLSMVDTGQTLIRAALAGKGPDIALMIAQGTPVELAARGALVDLTKYVTNDLYDNFQEASWTPFYYQNKIYALPESQAFNVLFYRTDIFKQLGIKVPNTWNDLYKVLEVLQSNNLSIGLNEINSAEMGVSASLFIFASLLEQKGGMYYVDDLSKTQFDKEIAYESFTEWSRFYTDYGLSRQIDFYSRFRTGELPLGFTGIGTYAQIHEAAPEIRGLWAMAPIPGTVKEDGSIDRTQPSTVTGCIMLKAAEERGIADEAFEFMNWWVSADAQNKYGNDLEIALGVAGRYYSANLEAFSKVSWASEEKEMITAQRNWLKNQPSVIGSYAVNRDLTSALREVIDGTNRARRALMLYNSNINEEIQRKREEFNIK